VDPEHIQFRRPRLQIVHRDPLDGVVELFVRDHSFELSRHILQVGLRKAANPEPAFLVGEVHAEHVLFDEVLPVDLRDEGLWLGWVRAIGHEAEPAVGFDVRKVALYFFHQEHFYVLGLVAMAT